MVYNVYKIEQYYIECNILKKYTDGEALRCDELLFSR